MLEWYEKAEFEDIDFMLLVAFRGSAKTSIAKIKACRDILYKRHSLIGYVTYERESAGEALFDILTWLQTNAKILNDFGNVFDKRIDGTPEKKTQGNFVTSSGVRVTAISIKQSVRGKQKDFERPNCYIIDDIENNTTKRSYVKTRATMEFIKELFTGLGNDPEVLIVGNYITDTGVIAWLEDIADGNPDWYASHLPLIQDGSIMWADKYVHTDIDKLEDARPNERKPISIQALKRTMNKDGGNLFEQEMLLEPSTQEDRFFDIDKIDEALKQCKEFVKIGNWKYFIDSKDSNVRPLEYYHEQTRKRGRLFWGAVGADVAEGFGNDSSVIQILDFETGEQLAEFESNQIEPTPLGLLMVEAGKQLGNCMLCPERNSIGVATIDAIRSTGYTNLYVETTPPTSTLERAKKEYGWRTTSASKPKILFDFKRDFEAGLIKINSKPLLREMRAFNNDGVRYTSFDPEASNHFDRIMAAAIAWEMRNVRQGGVC